MLIIILSIIIIIPVLAGFMKFFKEFWENLVQDFSAQLFSGVFFLAMIWQVFAFFIPLNI